MMADTTRAVTQTLGPGKRLLNGRFELEERLGDGGMGVVYRALDREAARLRDPTPHVALKVLTAKLRSLPDPELILQQNRYPDCCCGLVCCLANWVSCWRPDWRSRRHSA